MSRRECKAHSILLERCDHPAEIRPGEGARHRPRRQCGRVVLLTQVCEHDVAHRAVGAVRRRTRRRIVAQMPVTTGDSALQHRRIGAVPQHFRILVLLDHQDVDVRDCLSHTVGNGAEVVHDRRSRAARARGDDDRNRLIRIM
jgi:hypothetical protein